VKSIGQILNKRILSFSSLPDVKMIQSSVVYSYPMLNQIVVKWTICAYSSVLFLFCAWFYVFFSCMFTLKQPSICMFLLNKCEHNTKKCSDVYLRRTYANVVLNIARGVRKRDCCKGNSRKKKKPFHLSNSIERWV
jgi:hypothetical protein